jgi:hypothetical protein
MGESNEKLQICLPANLVQTFAIFQHGPVAFNAMSSGASLMPKFLMKKIHWLHA